MKKAVKTGILAMVIAVSATSCNYFSKEDGRTMRANDSARVEVDTTANLKPDSTDVVKDNATAEPLPESETAKK